MTTPALSGPSQTAGTDEPVIHSEQVPPLCPVLGHVEDAEQGEMSDGTWAVFQELRPQFEGLLPLGVVRECVNNAVQDLHGSISPEALPEMAIRLAAVRLERQLRGPGEPTAPLRVSDDGFEPSRASRTTMATPPFSVLRPSTPGYPPVALTVTLTGRSRGKSTVDRAGVGWQRR